MNSKTTKFICTILIISMIMPVTLFSFSRRAHAGGLPVYDGVVSGITTSIEVTSVENAAANTEDAAADTENAANTLATWLKRVGEYILMAIIQQILDQMTQSIVNWINSGFHGAPLFLENPDDFFGDILKYQVRSMVDQFGYDLARFPFGKDWALSVIGAYKSTLANNVAHTMSSYMSAQQIVEFNTFANSGWDGFFVRTQYPQNNFVGSQMMLNHALSIDLSGLIQPVAEKVTEELNRGMGFLSPEMCMDEGTTYNDTMANAWNRPSFEGKCVPAEPACTNTPNGCTAQQYQEWSAECAKQKAEFDKNNTCKNLVKTTPGSVVANQIMGSLSTGREETLQGAVLGSLAANVATVVDALINKFIGDGLTALADTINDEEPPEDNWSYYGQCLDENCDSNTGPGPLDIPQNVSVMTGETTSTEISGGKAPYSIKITDPITPDMTIATADLTGTTLLITGIMPGQTSVTITDSRVENPRKVKVKITVVGDGSLMIAPAEIIVEEGTEIIATISGGTEPYTISSNPNKNLVMVMQAGSKLVFHGIKKGSTSLTIKDSSSPVLTVTVPITVITPNYFMVTPKSINSRVGESSTAKISGGTDPYEIETEPDKSIATAKISENLLTITGLAVGKTSVNIKDSSSPGEIISIDITIRSALPTE